MEEKREISFLTLKCLALIRTCTTATPGTPCTATTACPSPPLTWTTTTEPEILPNGVVQDFTRQVLAAFYIGCIKVTLVVLFL